MGLEARRAIATYQVTVFCGGLAGRQWEEVRRGSIRGLCVCCKSIHQGRFQLAAGVKPPLSKGKGEKKLTLSDEEESHLHW